MYRHIMVIHRWRDRYALYENYVDHGSARVTYITTALGRHSVPSGATAIELVGSTEDPAAVRQAGLSLISRFGRPHHLVALNEGDMDLAAVLRAEFDCPGLHPADLARFRDKLTMVQLVSAAGLRTPAFADAPHPEAVERFAVEYGWPVIVKPRRGTASRGVLRLDSAADLGTLRKLPSEPRLVEEFCPGHIYHADGLWTGTSLGPWRLSRYLNTCMGFTKGDVLGSVEVDDSVLIAALEPFVASVVEVLSKDPWVFHLEIFVDSAPDGSVQATFLEVGYRVGGAEIPFIWREVHGVDLMAAAMAVALGLQPEIDACRSERVGGWLLVPTPVAPPCRVTSVELPSPAGAGPYAYTIPAIGDVVPNTGGYEHIGARFRFQGGSSREVENAIISTASGTCLSCVPALVPG